MTDNPTNNPKNKQKNNLNQEKANSESKKKKR